MAVMVIVGILVAIAVPSYRNFTMKANRSDAKIALTNYAQQLERCYTTSQTYAGCLVMPQPTPQGFYTVNFIGAPADAAQYTLQATPLGAQVNDLQCPTFSLNQANVRLPAGATCW
jgi:type IV pilus assembly protein PilE